MSDRRTFAELYEEKFEMWLDELLDRFRDKPSVTGNELRAVIINLREYFKYHTRVNKENMEKKINLGFNIEKHIKDIHSTMPTCAENLEQLFENWTQDLLDKLIDKPSVTGIELRTVITNLREYLVYHTEASMENMEKKLFLVSEVNRENMEKKINLGTKNNYLCEIEQSHT